VVEKFKAGHEELLTIETIVDFLRKIDSSAITLERHKSSSSLPSVREEDKTDSQVKIELVTLRTGVVDLV